MAEPVRVMMFSAQRYDQQFFDDINARQFSEQQFQLAYQAAALTVDSVVLARGCDAVCVFVNDAVNAEVLQQLHDMGVKTVLLRCAGFNNVDLAAAHRLGMRVARVPAYSPEAVAEHAIALIMTLNRHTHRAYNRVREGNLMLDGLLGYTMFGKTVGIVGTGKIGLATARILRGFGCHVLGHDPYPSAAFREIGEYTDFDTLLARADIVSLHCPLSPATHHLIDGASVGRMKRGATLVNTSRGALIDTTAVIDALKSHQLGALAIDVYEQESELFFRDHSSEIIGDDVFQRLMTFPNVLVTGHQGFFTKEALSEIAVITLGNLQCYADGRLCPNEVLAD